MKVIGMQVLERNSNGIKQGEQSGKRVCGLAQRSYSSQRWKNWAFGGYGIECCCLKNFIYIGMASLQQNALILLIFAVIRVGKNTRC